MTFVSARGLGKVSALTAHLFEMIVDPIDALLKGFPLLQLPAPDRQKKKQAAYEKDRAAGQNDYAQCAHLLPQKTRIVKLLTVKTQVQISALPERAKAAPQGACQATEAVADDRIRGPTRSIA